MNRHLQVSALQNRNAAADLAAKGFSRHPLPIDVEVALALQALSAAAWRLPRDAYYTCGDRYRRLTRYVVTVTRDGVDIELQDGAVRYFQLIKYNPELGGRTRDYEPNEPEIVMMSGIAKMIAHHVMCLPDVCAGNRFHVNFHLTRFFATPGRSSETSPAGLHKDGEKYIATHLIARCGVTGGQVVLTDNNKDEVQRFTLRDLGECYLIDDDRVWHMLTPVEVSPGNQVAYRDVCIFDILPDGWSPS